MGRRPRVRVLARNRYAEAYLEAVRGPADEGRKRPLWRARYCARDALWTVGVRLDRLGGRQHACRGVATG